MRPAVIALAIILATAALARGKEAAPPKPAARSPRGLTRTVVGQGVIADTRLEGNLVAWTHVRGVDAWQEFLVLLKPAEPRSASASEPKPAGSVPATPAPGTTTAAACTVVDDREASEKPRTLVRFDARGEGTIDELRSDIPEDTEGLGALDVDGDGHDELLLYRPGRIEMIAPGSDHRFTGARTAIVEDADLGVGRTASGLGPENGPDGPRLRFPVVGALRTWAPDSLRAHWRTVSDAPTPFDAAPRAESLDLVGPRVLSCGRDASGHARFATEAEVVGRDRLRARLLDPEAAPESRSLTCWAKLPSPERVLDQACVMLDGAPHLVVTTMSSAKMSFFAEKMVRVFPLSPDRSRTGAAPSFAVTSGLNLWQSTIPGLADVNGDGRSDLVLAYWKGLKDSIVVLEVYTRRSDGGFEPTARRTEMEVDDGDKSWIGWGDDVDGDARGDLLIFAGKKLLLFPGASSSDGRKLTTSKPSASLPWPADAPDVGWVWVRASAEGTSGGVQFGSMGAPVVVDLNGDHRVEVILAGNDDDGGRVIVFSFTKN